MASQFCASSSNLGYLFQIRYGLMVLLGCSDDQSALLIEELDDISIETTNMASVYQTKFHNNAAPNLTDKSPDFWKTIRVWAEGITSQQFNPKSTIFHLVTTATISDDSLTAKLKYDKVSGRSTDSIIQDMLTIAGSANPSEQNKKGYEAFMALSADEQKDLVKNISVIDASPGIDEARTSCLKELRFSTYRPENLYERLEGWFLGEVIKQLKTSRTAITASELRAKILDIADTLKEDNLPADFLEPISGDENQLAPYREWRFVKQLEVIDVNSRTINIAISDYHRAFSQLSKWEAEGLILPSDHISYHSKLGEDWDRKFSAACEILPDDDEAKLKDKGKQFYTNFYVNTPPAIHIKVRFSELYLITGSCHMLADLKKIGWHPKFNDIIS